MGFRNLSIDLNYSGRGQTILEDFVLPVLSHAEAYDRVTSFFSVQSLVAIAAGLESLWKRHGQMRLVLGIHDVPADLAEATILSEESEVHAITLLKERLIKGLSELRDEIAINRLATVAWMIKDGLLLPRVAIPDNSLAQSPGIFHNKQLIFRDSKGDVITAVGSPNETGSGLGANIESLTVFKSWEDDRYTSAQIASFNRLWRDEHDGLAVRPLDAGFADEILANLPDCPTLPAGSRDSLADVLNAATRMPSLAMVSGGHTALFPHQETAFLASLSRWPVRVLLADEVGLGKTFEAAAVIRYMIKHGGISRVLILAPRAVIHQWQAELQEHFGIEAWVYDSARRSYVSPTGDIALVHPSEPILGRATPRVAIVSSQLARGTRSGGHIFGRASVLPEMLVVDEVHSARVKPDLAGDERPTLMWRMLDQIAPKIPHLLFATATPMQMHWREYHALLDLLGLPREWSNSENYSESLKLISNPEVPDLAEAGLICNLIRSSLQTYSPHELHLDSAEESLATECSRMDWNQISASLDIQRRWDVAQKLLVKCHPAQFLTIRNTRTALERIGYNFPSRTFPDVSLQVPDEITTFYRQVEAYLADAYFSVERELYPGRKFAVGFVKCAYQQRVASSLFACETSLRRRLNRVTEIEAGVINFDSLETDLEELGESDFFDEESPFDARSANDPSAITLRRAAEAASLERSYIDGLLGSLLSIYEGHEDPKLVEMRSIIDRHLNQDDRILVFSRYTDTLDGAIAALTGGSTSTDIPYAIYSGKTAAINLGSGIVISTRKGVRQALEEGNIKVVFCSDAASEGLNLQAARVIINIDVPWNPARLEQRIGRIARLGQRAATVDIYNLWYPDSIEARMYTRLMQRRDLFELAVGEFPEVVGKALREDIASRFGGNSSNPDPISQLNSLKNDVQVQALRRLWDREIPHRTLTGKFRVALAHLVVGVLERLGARVTDLGHAVKIEFSGEYYSFSTEPGRDDVISLVHPVLDLLMFEKISQTAALSIMRTENGPQFFAQQDGVPIDPESLPALIDAILRVPVGLNDSTIAHLEISDGGRVAAAWLPNPDGLTIPSSVSPLPDSLSPCTDGMKYIPFRF